MSCIHKFFEENYDHILQIAQIKVGEDAGDLINDLCLSYLEDAERITPICERGELMSYICRTIAICGFSKTSRFYYKYKKANELISRNFPQALLRNEEQIVDNVRDIDKELEVAYGILQDVSWFDAEVFRIYYLHNHSLKTLSDATGISKSTLYKSIQNTQDYLKENSKRIGGLNREANKGDRD
tara:strand:+ start:2391 stop:2942 length:552 start_codon:yes stop_codon:yes gene_type:complete